MKKRKEDVFAIDLKGKVWSPDQEYEEVNIQPKYLSWKNYIEVTTEAERLKWCRIKANTANRKRLLSDEPKIKLNKYDVWNVLVSAKGRCCHCDSLAVESCPNSLNGKPLPWAFMGRRIGSLEHLRSRYSGGDNELYNLAWCCLWCNTWASERIKGATDHGGYYL